ncbi:acylase [Pseudomonas savastanoi pv. phaseolicola]|uniref:Acyl-homoserine lactone acylase PvdQ n=4 Tax=Pseudomonas savastanoi TaxID=29438 RepID=PVDQ_PSE14|nr:MULTISPECIES: acylase [Pseudomonas]Q48KB0.1 RecName: Full=Acyl-homoserine lactone acylase PvdQ; Short=AHL acylase PvdQ; Short=Acyl-HSL acylase PvdQ; Contains: RecName: Full=Acyl-homoserine lactone acylase PvdQ subunit alpha; Short=Acyl-HSL acylase PvdQ subunit alpha; Contains: RecName: Full=Acyl-homoserine lactone acylase PvdQ subunit beta; Short=Acyl-HSL acylase PvdQ subunit beta; Flags: Precursor [Pseudomonas savastanoi pv. phaseolicola 1448A]AAZ35979.1 penicillin amidase family protein [Pse
MIISRPLCGFVFAGLSFAVILPAQALVAADNQAARAEIRRTGFGVPHIVAANERGLGYGIGYAYAQDNLCLLANEVVTVNGERSRYFGPDKATLEQRSNMASDLLFKWLNTPEALADFWKAQPPEIRQLMQGYVAGYNRSLDEQKTKGLPRPCAADWVRPISTDDLLRLTRRLLVEGGVGQFTEAFAGAKPPSAQKPLQVDSQQVQALQLAAVRNQRFALERGSNAVAVGHELSANGRGMLLANPHFPWGGGMRFYQMHLTIPGKLDVMGAALPGLPLINIGFNRHLAWSHTVDTSKHFTLHRLQLDPKDSTRYLLDGKSIAMGQQQVSVEVKQPDGSLKDVPRIIYSSKFGPVVQWPGKLDWDDKFAFSLRDANLENDRVLQQWYSMDKADSLKAFQDSLHKIQGIPWVNTLAVDAKGQALYMNLSVVPNVDAAKLAKCSDPRIGTELIVLDGSRSECNWDISAEAAQAGIYPSSRQPQLLRSDFVQHSNDSAWMVNPAAPLKGFSPLISQDGQPLGQRARFALDRLGSLQQAGKVSAENLQAMVMDNEVYQAGQVLPDLLKFCASELGDDVARLTPLCAALKAWDGRADLNSGIGFVYFQRIMTSMQGVASRWRVVFDPQNPIHTPSGLAIENPQVASALRAAMLAAVDEVAKAGLSPESKWGDIQVSSLSGKPIPIHGGPAGLGVYNAMQTIAGKDGKREVVSGTSYLQVVTFDEQGPRAQGLLAFSESSNPQSAHSSDQTEAFSKKQWSELPFTEQQIKADPAYQVQVISEEGSR